MVATDIGTLFLDASLRIKRFTQRVTELFSIVPSDEGRPITDFTHQLEYDDLVEDARTVLASLVPAGREIRRKNGQWYDVRILPYRTLDDKIDGVVVTFVDITERRQVEEVLRESRKRWDEQQAMLHGELTHRIKNIITVVQAVASQTARESEGDGDFMELFRGRLMALANAHGALVQSDWQGADLEALVRAELEPFESKRAGRIRISGEPEALRIEARRAHSHFRRAHSPAGRNCDAVRPRFARARGQCRKAWGAFGAGRRCRCELDGAGQGRQGLADVYMARARRTEGQ
jgi:two-component system CheB/CheR fusion protein